MLTENLNFEMSIWLFTMSMTVLQCFILNHVLFIMYFHILHSMLELLQFLIIILSKYFSYGLTVVHDVTFYKPYMRCWQKISILKCLYDCLQFVWSYYNIFLLNHVLFIMYFHILYSIFGLLQFLMMLLSSYQSTLAMIKQGSQLMLQRKVCLNNIYVKINLRVPSKMQKNAQEKMYVVVYVE